VAQGLSFQPDGNTVALSVANSSHSAVTITCTSGGAQNLYIQNPSANPVAFNVLGGGGTAAAAVFPVDGTPANGFVVPAGAAKIISASPNPSVTAIALVAGPSIVYLTPGSGGVTA
jgi:hypothetical protein